MDSQAQKQETKTNVHVDPETFLEITVAKYDNDIADAEFAQAQANLKVFELKRNKAKAIIDYHYHRLKTQQAIDAKSQEVSNQFEAKNTQEEIIEPKQE